MQLVLSTWLHHDLMHNYERTELHWGHDLHTNLDGAQIARRKSNFLMPVVLSLVLIAVKVPVWLCLLLIMLILRDVASAGWLVGGAANLICSDLSKSHLNFRLISK